MTSDATEPTTPAADTALVIEALHGLPNQAVYNSIVTWGTLMAASGFFKDAKSAAQAAVKILYGTEMGFSIGASMAGVHVIEGRPTLAAHLQAAKVRQSGRYDYAIAALTDELCTIDWLRRGADGKLEKFGETTFTIEDALRAHLLGRQAQNWEKYPRNMLFARALTNGIRFFCPDIFTGGPVYTPDELAPDLALTEGGDLQTIEAIIVPPGQVTIESTPRPATARSGIAPPPQARPARPQEPRSRTGQPQRPEDIEDLGGLLWWTRNLLAQHDRPNETRHILDLYEVTSPVELRTKYASDFQHAAAFAIAAVQTIVTADRLTPEQRVIYDDARAVGSSHEDALLLAAGDDDLPEEDRGQEAEDDEPDGDGSEETPASATGESGAVEASLVRPDAPAEGEPPAPA